MLPEQVCFGLFVTVPPSYSRSNENIFVQHTGCQPKPVHCLRACRGPEQPSDHDPSPVGDNSVFLHDWLHRYFDKGWWRYVRIIAHSRPKCPFDVTIFGGHPFLFVSHRRHFQLWSTYTKIQSFAMCLMLGASYIDAPMFNHVDWVVGWLVGWLVAAWFQWNMVNE